MSHSLAARPAVHDDTPPLMIREHVPPRAWSRVVPLSSRGRPLLARDRRPDEGEALDRFASPLVGALAVLAVALAALLIT